MITVFSGWDTLLLRRCLAVTLAAISVTTGCRSSETALGRGDRFWADSNYTAALAEYRLAARQDGGDPSTLARVAHAYAVTGQLERARETYEQLLKQDSRYADQAVFDYLTLARDALERGDRFGVARAAEAALALRPGIPLGNMATELARFHASSGDGERALEYFERALVQQPPEAVPPLLFEMATLHERQGGCADAISYYRAYLQRAAYADNANEARFRLGTCAFELGRRSRDAGNYEDALGWFEMVGRQGYPANLVDQAWFEAGEALLVLGRRDEALDAYRRAIFASSPQSQVGPRAQRRVQEILLTPR